MSESENEIREKKRKIGDILNELLGTSIDWEKLSIEDLVTLAKLFTNPDKIFERIKRAREKTQEAINNLKKLVKDIAVSFIKYWDGPIIRALKRVIEEASTDEK